MQENRNKKTLTDQLREDAEKSRLVLDVNRNLQNSVRMLEDTAKSLKRINAIHLDIMTQQKTFETNLVKKLARELNSIARELTAFHDGLGDFEQSTQESEDSQSSSLNIDVWGGDK